MSVTSEYGSEAEGDFDEAAWNDRRVELEDSLQFAAWELIKYMGTSHFTINDELDQFVVLVRPKGCDEVPN